MWELIEELVNIEGHESLARYRAALRNYLRLGPKHLFMYLAGRFQVVRALGVRYYQARSHPHSVALSHSSLLGDLDVSRVVAGLKKEGLFIGLRLREDTLEQLRQFCENGICFGNGDPKKAFLLRDKAGAEQAHAVTFSVGRYLNCLDRCSAIQDLAADPILLSIARGYLGAEPTLIGARIWWSFVVSSDLDQQMRDGQAFHYDLDDYRAIAFFFYLSDVGLESGPHAYVRGSHRRKPLRFLISPFKSRSDEQVIDFYGSNQIAVVCGEAGSGFAEDLFGFHKGSHATVGDRLLLQIRYGYRVYADHAWE